MIVIENGREHVGKNVEINVTSVLQKSAGRSDQNAGRRYRNVRDIFRRSSGDDVGWRSAAASDAADDAGRGFTRTWHGGSVRDATQASR